MGPRLWSHVYGVPSMGPRLWGDVYGVTPMGSRLWGPAYGDPPIGARLWGHVYGGTSMGGRLRGHVYGATSMGPRLWGHVYGATSMGPRLWGHVYGATSMGPRLWDHVYVVDTIQTLNHTRPPLFVHAQITSNFPPEGKDHFLQMLSDFVLSHANEVLIRCKLLGGHSLHCRRDTGRYEALVSGSAATQHSASTPPNPPPKTQSKSRTHFRLLWQESGFPSSSEDLNHSH